MSETAIGLSDLLTQGNKMIAAWREALNDLEALLYLIERASGQKPARTATLEEARILLSRKARSGYRAEVKALLTKYGYEKLTDISDPRIFGALVEEAEQFE